MYTALSPHLYFDGNAQQALKFYRELFDGDLNLTTFGDMQIDDGPPDQVYLGELRIDGTLITASDLTPEQRAAGDRRGQPRTYLQITGDDEEIMADWFDALSGADAGHDGVEEEFDDAGGGYLTGRCVDRFGVGWIIRCELT